MLEAGMVSIPEECNDNIPITYNPYVSTKKPSVRKSLRQYKETLYVKHNTDVSRFRAAKENRKDIKKGNLLC